MFDVAATRSLTITGFAMNLLGGGAHTVDAYSTPGSSVGKEANAELRISNGNAECSGLFGSPNPNCIWIGTVNYRFTP